MADKTWTGGGADNNWSTGGNWGGAAPVAGDNIIFDGGTSVKDCSVDVIISSGTYGNLTFQNGYTGLLTCAFAATRMNVLAIAVDSNVSITGNEDIFCTTFDVSVGNTLNLVWAILINASGNFTCAGSIIGAGNLTVNGTTQFTGSVQVRTISCYGDFLASNSLTIATSGVIHINTPNFYVPTTLVGGYAASIQFYYASGTTYVHGDLTFPVMSTSTGVIDFQGNDLNLTLYNATNLINGTILNTGGTLNFQNLKINATGVVGSVNTNYNLSVRSMLFSPGTLYAPNASGSFTVSQHFYQPATFYHSNGKILFNGANSFIYTGDFYDIEIGTVPVGIDNNIVISCNDLIILFGGRFGFQTQLGTFTINGVLKNDGQFGKNWQGILFAYDVIINGSIDPSSTGVFDAPPSPGSVEYKGSSLDLSTAPFNHSNGMIMFNRTGAQSLTLPSGNISTFYDLIIGGNSVTTTTKVIARTGSITGSITQDQVPSGILTIHDLVVSGVLYAGTSGWTGEIIGVTDPDGVISKDSNDIDEIIGV